ncbi:MAG: hypothetical protein IJI54_02955 [Kiritimatiellae bacterium]|nr:hypothetical protein [Kiritimatiellia bacterium]
MVILQFNKLIRNKWVWGVFAIVVSLAFVAPDEWFRGRDDDRRGADGRNRLENVEMDDALYEQCRMLSDGFLEKFPSRVGALFAGKTERDVWKMYAAVTTFRKAGFTIPDAVLAERVRAVFVGEDGGFNEDEYAARVKNYFNADVKTFETMVRLVMTLEYGLGNVIGTSSWPSPMEADQAARDFTDKLTVQVATFTEDKDVKEMKLDDKGLKEWFDENVSKLSVPDRFKLRYVKFEADSSNALARVKLSEADIKARYDANAEKGMYDIKPATTNDVKKVKPLADVRADIEKALRAEGALELVKGDVDDLTGDDIYWNNPEAAKGLLPKVAQSTKRELKTSGWLSLGYNQLRALSNPIETEFPGVRRARPDILASVCNGDRPFGIVASDKAVWLVDLVEKSPKHTPTFDEAKSSIGDMALRDAKAKAFKTKVEDFAKKGVKAVLESGNVTTNFTFAACDFVRDEAMGWANRYGEWDFSKAGFQNAEPVVFAARKLSKGQVSEFIPLGFGRGILVVCNDRRSGDAAELLRGERFAKRVSAGMQSAEILENWLESNLVALGFKERSGDRRE